MFKDTTELTALGERLKTRLMVLKKCTILARFWRSMRRSSASTNKLCSVEKHLTAMTTGMREGGPEPVHNEWILGLDFTNKLKYQMKLYPNVKNDNTK